jgi:hypothetical protein
MPEFVELKRLEATWKIKLFPSPVLAMTKVSLLARTFSIERSWTPRDDGSKTVGQVHHFW